jgi:uncharacterized membrane-anchored protein
MPRFFAPLAVALPVLVVIIGIVRAELYFAGSRDVTFEIAGYDPRDLLRGRYLQFRLRVEESPALEACKGPDCCLCLRLRGRETPPLTARASCATARRECVAALPTRYVDQQLRYYVPELEASNLEQQLMDAMQHRAAQVVLAIDGEGRAEVRALKLWGREIPGAVGAASGPASDDSPAAIER